MPEVLGAVNVGTRVESAFLQIHVCFSTSLSGKRLCGLYCSSCKEKIYTDDELARDHRLWTRVIHRGHPHAAKLYNKDAFGTSRFILCREVVLSEVIFYRAVE